MKGKSVSSIETIAILGSGPVGRAIARRAAGVGISVVISNSRGPESLRAFTADVMGPIRAASSSDAIESSDLVVAAIPLSRHESLNPSQLAGKTVIDTMNYAPNDDWSSPHLDTDEMTSSQLVQSHLSASKVVKAFNNFGPHQMEGLARPTGAADRTAMPIAGDDAASKGTTTVLLDRLGFDAVDIGGLSDSWRTEPNMPAYAFCYLPPLPNDLGSIEEMLTWISAAPGVTVTAGEMRELVGSAVRGPAGFRL